MVKNKKIEKWKKPGKSGASTNESRRLPENAKKGGFTHLRDKATIKLLNLYNDKPDIEKMH